MGRQIMDTMNDLYDDIPKHKKKARNKTPRKSNHTHIYEPCVLEYPIEWWKKAHERSDKQKTEIGAFCPICGKIGVAKQERWYKFDITPFPNAVMGRVRHIVPTDECARELDPATRTLPTFTISDPFQKFVEVKNKIGV